MKIKHQPRPSFGTTRTRTKFLWWPKRIWNETRWLERATWREEYLKIWDGGDWYYEEWRKNEWIDEQTN